MIQILIALLTGFVALTAVGGGIAILVGLEAERFPLEWLQDTPFNDYTIPALILAIVVGGSSLMACITVLKRKPIGGLLTIAAGLFLVDFITVEVLILKQVPPGPTVFELIYFGFGLAMLGLGVLFSLTQA